MIEQAEIFALMNRNRTEFVKSSGRPAIGWLSIYTPEEILDAAGLVPFRITGEFAQNTSEAGSMLCSNFCSYLLHSLSEGIEGIYDFADGIVIVDECDWRKRLYEAWKKQLNPPFTYFLELPKVITPESKAYFRLQLKKWVAALESHYQIQITDEALRRSISLHNETRTLLQRLYKLRQSESSPVTGMEALQIMKAATAGRKEEFNRELARFLDDLEARNEPQTKPHRVLVCGSYFDQPELVEIIERTGAQIVCEDTSFGIKYAEGRIEENEDPLTAIADYYLEKATCARMYDSDIRLNHLLDLIKTYKADSVIYFTLKFCDIYLMDYPYVMSRLQQQGISVLFIEGEQQMSNIQSIKTRVQTFLETRMF